MRGVWCDERQRGDDEVVTESIQHQESAVSNRKKNNGVRRQERRRARKRLERVQVVAKTMAAEQQMRNLIATDGRTLMGLRVLGRQWRIRGAARWTTADRADATAQLVAKARCMASSA